MGHGHQIRKALLSESFSDLVPMTGLEPAIPEEPRPKRGAYSQFRHMGSDSISKNYEFSKYPSAFANFLPSLGESGSP